MFLFQNWVDFWSLRFLKMSVQPSAPAARVNSENVVPVHNQQISVVFYNEQNEFSRAKVEVILVQK